MTGSNVAVDTNKAIAVLNSDPAAVRRMQGHAGVYLPVPVLAELKFGALNSGKVIHNLQRVDDFASRLMLLPVTAATADTYARLRFDMKRAGTPIPQNDLWIAATCVEHGLPLATADAHFSVVPGLVVDRS